MKSFLIFNLLLLNAPNSSADYYGRGEELANKKIHKNVEVSKQGDYMYYDSYHGHKFLYDDNQRLVFADDFHYCLDVQQDSDVVAHKCDHSDSQSWIPQIIPETYNSHTGEAYFRLYSIERNQFMDYWGMYTKYVITSHDNYSCDCQKIGPLPIGFFRDFYSKHRRRELGGSDGRLKGYGGNPPPSAYPLQRCEGDCDNDHDCASSLVCFQREKHETVPGCEGNLDSETDYCIARDIDHSPSSPSYPTYSSRGEVLVNKRTHEAVAIHHKNEALYFVDTHGQKFMYDGNFRLYITSNGHRYCLDVEHDSEVSLNGCNRHDTQVWIPQIIPKTYSSRSNEAYFRLYNVGCNQYMDYYSLGKNWVITSHSHYDSDRQQFGPIPVQFFDAFYSNH